MKLHEYMTYCNIFRENSILAVNIENFENFFEKIIRIILLRFYEKKKKKEKTQTRQVSPRTHTISTKGMSQGMTYKKPYYRVASCVI